ncbi:MAG: tetratricopeptide repeat protein [Planctomycetaceae bacterium]|nr:tetratricopeptide repeat protein [Planctomycetaceae bacterium]
MRFMDLTILVAIGVAAILGGCRKGTSPTSAPASAPLPAKAAQAGREQKDGRKSPVAGLQPGDRIVSIGSRRVSATRPSQTMQAVEAARVSVAAQEFLPPQRLAASRSASGPLDADLVEGDAALAAGNLSGAEAAFRRLLERRPKDYDALCGLATTLTAGGHNLPAMLAYQRILALRKDDHTARFNLAVAMSRLGRFDEAEQEFITLLKQNADDVRARYNLAMVLAAHGKLDDARYHLKGVVSRTDSLPSAYAILGQVLIDLGDDEGAMEAYGKAAALQGDNVDNWKNYAAAAQAAGSYGRAILAATRVTKLNSSDPAAWAYLGDLHMAVYESTQKEHFLRQAREAWMRSLSLNPEQEPLRAKLRAAPRPKEP